MALTYFSSVFALAYGPIQFRLSEALTLLPFYFPAAIPGLVVGCFLANLGSPYGLVDLIFGSLASLLAALATGALGRLKDRWPAALFLAPLPVIFINAFIIGAEITFFLPQAASLKGFFISASQVALGQAVVVFSLGLPLTLALSRTRFFSQI